MFGVGLLRRRRRQLPVARQRAGLGRLHRSAPATRSSSRAWGSIDVDYRSTVDRNGMLNLPQGRQLQRRRRQGRRPREEPARADRPALHQLQLSRVARPAARPARLRRRPGAAARRRTRCRASRRCCRRSSRPAGRARTGSMRKILLRRDGKVDLRARRLRVPGPGRQVARTSSSPPATSSCSSRPGRASPSPARSTRRRSTS